MSHDLANLYIIKYHNFYNADMYQNGENRWLRQAVISLQNPVIFDVGANIGEWTHNVLAINPSAVVHTFEPTPTSFEEISKRSYPSQVYHNNMGLGDETKSLVFYDYGGEHAHNSLYQRHDKPYQQQITISIDTLAHYCTQHAITRIHYLKIDTEGNDYRVLVGAKPLLEQGQIDMIQFEYGDNYLDARVFLKDIFDLIAPLPYSIYLILPNQLRHIPQYHQTYERFMYANYVIIHNQVAERLKFEHK